MSAQWPSAVSTAANLYTAVNLLQTTLSGTINSAVTTIALTSTSGFPTAGAVTIDNEVIFYTNISGGNLTGCTRGSDGTTAASHNSGVPVGATVLAYHVNSLNTEVIAIEQNLSTRFGLGSTDVTIASGKLSVTTAQSLFYGGLAGTSSLRIGADAGAYTLTNSTTKRGQISLPHYTSASQAEIALLAAISTSTDNIIAFGGGSTTLTAATQIQFLTASSNTSVAGGTQAMSIDTNQNVIVGAGSTRVVNGINSMFQVEGTSASARPSIILNINSAAGSLLQLGKSRGASNGSSTIVQNGDFIGGIYMMGANGVDMSAACAYILASINGTPSATSMPGQLDLATTQVGSIGPTVALTLNAVQQALFTNGTTSLPAMSFISDPDTGIYRGGANDIVITTGGADRLEISTTKLITGNLILGADGGFAAPSYSFGADQDTGFYRIGTNNMGIAAGGAKVVDIGAGTFEVEIDLSVPTATINTGNTKYKVGGNQMYPVVQMVTSTSTTLFSTTSSTFQTTNLSVSITPKFSSSKIYVVATGSMGDSTGNKVVQATIARGGSSVLGTGGGAVWNVSIAGILPVTLQVYDSPGSTSAQTYAVQVRNFDNVSTVNFGAGTSPEVTQYITAIEIAQ